jgi:KRAB domain-containing zinc finger protein
MAPRHTNERPFKCDECELSFKRYYTMLDHKRYKHALARPYACKQCDQSFVKLAERRIHEMKVHPTVAIADNAI